MEIDLRNNMNLSLYSNDKGKENYFTNKYMFEEVFSSNKKEIQHV